jgi:hypothetical protein
MPLCPQITNTPITVTQTADFTVSSVLPVVPATTTQLDEVIVLADGKTKAFYQTTAPTVGVSEGDIWFDTDDGNKQYYYNGTAWVSVQDTAIAAAQSAATAAQTTADGKNKIYRQGSTPTGTFSVGDLWFNTSNDNAISRWDGSSWVLNTLGNNALASISANKITAGTIDASVITVSNINAGNISTGNLSADRIASASITGTKIAAGTILASNIATGTITATQIAAGTITTTQLATGTLSANNITTGTLSASVGITATTGTIGGFTISSTSIFSSTNLVIESTGNISGGNSQTLFYGFVNIGGGSVTGERLIVAGTSALNGNTGVLGNLSVTNSATFGAITQQFEFLSSTGNVRVASTYGNAVSGRSMQISSSGLYGTTASTRRKKHEIESYSIDSAALLNLDIKTFKYNPDIDEAQSVQYGFIAEEAQELGLDELIQYDSTGVPDYFAYEKLPIFLLQLIKELKAEIDTLKGE